MTSSSLFLCALLIPLVSLHRIDPSPCDALDAAFGKFVEHHESPACRCFVEPSSATDIWVACTGHSMPSVFDSLRAINETFLTRLHIWDSLINIIPTDMFDQVRPRKLSIERSGLALLRDNALNLVSSRITHLVLRKNILKTFEPKIFKGMTKVKKLDLSENRLSKMSAAEFSMMKDLTEMNVADNFIASIANGTFDDLANIRVLNLAGNQLSNITNSTFAGLVNLEVLDLSRNKLTSIDWTAFSWMKELKSIDLGSNRLTRVELRGLPNLHTLILNNNHIASLHDVALKDLPSLRMLNVDRNNIDDIGENDLFGLATSTRLNAISLSSNNISQMHPRALAHISPITILAMQNNGLRSLSADNQPWLAPLRKLKTLLLSGNSITKVLEGELPSSLQRISLNHNAIQTIEKRALSGLTPSHFFINHNHLNHLPEGTFDSFHNDSLVAFDLSNNDWMCLCGKEWLVDWLAANDDKDLAEHRTNGCLGTKICSPDTWGDDESHSAWVTGAAAVLAASSLLILVAIAWFFIDDSKTRSLPRGKEHKAKGRDADRLRLINDREKNTDVAATKSDEKKENGRRVRFDGEE